MIGGILRKKLEDVGIDVDYIMTGRKEPLALGEEPPAEDEMLCELCASKIQDIQGKLLELSAEVHEVNQMISRLKKSLQ